MNKIDHLVKYSNSVRITVWDNNVRVEADGYHAVTAPTVEEAAERIIQNILSKVKSELASAERQVKYQQTTLDKVKKMLGLDAPASD